MKNLKESIHSIQVSFAFFLALGICAFIYLQGLNGPFTLDDLPNIEAIAIDNIDADSLLTVFAKNQSGITSLTRVVPSLSLAINHALYGIGNAQTYKYVNVMLHLIIGCIIFLFIYNFDQAFSQNKKKSSLLALLSSSIWLLHPLHVSTTLYVIQRINQFSTLFTLLCLCCYLYGRKSDTNGKFIFYFLLFPTFLALGLLSKETTFLVCTYIIAIHYCTSNSKYWQNTNFDKIFFLLFGWAMLVAGIIGFILLSDSLLNYRNRDFNLLERGLSEIHVVLSYINKILLPKLSSMGLFIDDTPIQKHLDIETIIKSTLLLLLLLISILGIKKKHFLGISSLFFFGHLLE